MKFNIIHKYILFFFFFTIFFSFIAHSKTNVEITNTSQIYLNSDVYTHDIIEAMMLKNNIKFSGKLTYNNEFFTKQSMFNIELNNFKLRSYNQLSSFLHFFNFEITDNNVYIPLILKNKYEPHWKLFIFNSSRNNKKIENFDLTFFVKEYSKYKIKNYFCNFFSFFDICGSLNELTNNYNLITFNNMHHSTIDNLNMWLIDSSVIAQQQITDVNGFIFFEPTYNVYALLILRYFLLITAIFFVLYLSIKNEK